MSPLYFGGTDCPVCGATIPQGEPCQMCALRAQITEKDREIERLKEDATKAHGRYSRELMDMAQVVAMGRADLSASQAREREAREEARINLESAKAEAIDRDAMLARAMQAEAREREAVGRAEKAEAEAAYQKNRRQKFMLLVREKIKVRGNLLDITETVIEERDTLRSALAAARKALDTAWAAMCERRGYADAWEWKYGTTWDEEDAEVSAALAPEQKG